MVIILLMSTNSFSFLNDDNYFFLLEASFSIRRELFLFGIYLRAQRRKSRRAIREEKSNIGLSRIIRANTPTIITTIIIITIITTIIANIISIILTIVSSTPT